MLPRTLRRTFAASLLAALAACGGGVVIGFDDSEPPSVSLVADVTSARPGQTVRLAAAASDDWGIDHVTLYRLESDGGSTRIDSDDSEPYEWRETIPTDARDRVRYFARAVDWAGYRTDSEVVTIDIR